MLKNTVIQHLYKLNHSIGEVGVRYQREEFLWIISIMITLLEKLINDKSLIYDLAKTTRRMYLTHTLHVES